MSTVGVIQVRFIIWSFSWYPFKRWSNFTGYITLDCFCFYIFIYQRHPMSHQALWPLFIVCLNWVLLAHNLTFVVGCILIVLLRILITFCWFRLVECRLIAILEWLLIDFMGVCFVVITVTIDSNGDDWRLVVANIAAGRLHFIMAIHSKFSITIA